MLTNAPIAGLTHVHLLVMVCHVRKFFFCAIFESYIYAQGDTCTVNAVTNGEVSLPLIGWKNTGRNVPVDLPLVYVLY